MRSNYRCQMAELVNPYGKNIFFFDVSISSDDDFGGKMTLIELSNINIQDIYKVEYGFIILYDYNKNDFYHKFSFKIIGDINIDIDRNCISFSWKDSNFSRNEDEVFIYKRNKKIELIFQGHSN